MREMNFHGFSCVSKEEMNVIYEDDNNVVLSDDDTPINNEKFQSLDKSEHEFDSGDSYWIFSKQSGKCLNDERSFGCYRTIDL